MVILTRQQHKRIIAADSLDKIPGEIWIYIVSFFSSIRDVIRFTTTCKMWYDMSSLFIIDVPIIINDHNCTIFLQNCRWNLTNVIFSCCSPKNNRILSRIVDRPFLKTIRFFNCFMVRSRTSNNSIQHVDCHGNEFMTDKSVRFISKCLESFTNLQHINFSKCYNLTDEAVKYLSNCLESFTNLQNVNFSKCYNLTDKAVQYILKCPESFMHLQSINLSKCNRLTDEAVRCISNCLYLTEVNFSNCDKLTDEAVKYLSNCLHLQKVKFSNCNKLTNEAVRSSYKMF